MTLAEREVEKNAFDAELRKLDPRMFCELRLRDDGRPVWAVTIHVGEQAGGSPYRTVCYWTDPETGEPLPLTYRLLEKVKSLDGGFDGLTGRISEHNQKIVERSRRELREAVSDMASDMFPRMKETRSACLHRSVSLRMARDKRRARGEKC